MNKFQSILPPSRNKPTPGRFYQPPCSRYDGYPPGKITRFSRNYLMGTCSQNVDGMSDFVCRKHPDTHTWHCRDSTGRLQGSSPNSICCYGERRRQGIRRRIYPSVPSSCCSQGLEGCAKRLTYLEGHHQENKRIQRQNMYRCGRCVNLSPQERALLRD